MFPSATLGLLGGVMFTCSVSFPEIKKETINVEDQSKVVVCLTKKKDRKGVKWSCAQHSCEQNR